jgi:hypothetical protein
MIERGAKVAGDTVEALKTQPLALALVLVNVLFLIGGGWFLSSIVTQIAEGNARRDKMLTEFARMCSPQPNRTSPDLTALPQRE